MPKSSKKTYTSSAALARRKLIETQIRRIKKKRLIDKKRTKIANRQYQDPDEEHCTREEKMQNLAEKTGYMLMTGGWAGTMSGMILPGLWFDDGNMEPYVAYALFIGGSIIGTGIGMLFMRYAACSPFRDCNRLRKLNEEYAAINNSVRSLHP